MKLIISTFSTPIGCLKVEYDEHYLYRAFFDKEIPSEDKQTNSLSKKISDEIERYFLNPKHLFNLPLKPEGTSYQKSVWNMLLTIPSGQTLYYGELSAHLQSSPRAVGQACKKNPLALFIPCHRVIGRSDLGGYMGNIQENIDIKSSLLKYEGKLI